MDLQRGQITVVVLFILGSLTGCLDPSEEISLPIPRSFELTYERTILVKDTGESHSHRITLGLNERVKIHDADGNIREAYRLEAHDSRETVGNEDYFLDSSFRSIRVDRPYCWGQDPELPCDEMSMSWASRGLPVYGIGLVNIAMEGRTAISVPQGGPLDLKTVIDRESDGDLRVTVPSVPFATLSSTRPGSFWFEPGAFYPHRMKIPGEKQDNLMELIEAKDGDVLPLIASNDGLESRAGHVGSYAVYPGEDRDFFGKGWTVEDAFDRMREELPETRRILTDGGCVYEVFHNFRQRDHIAGEDWTIRTVFSILDADDHLRTWEVTYLDPGILPPQVSVNEDDNEDREIPLTCEEIFRSPPMSYSMSDVWDEGVALTGECIDQMRTWFRAHMRSDGPPETGWGRLSLLKNPNACDSSESSSTLPESSDSLLRHFGIDAHTGWYQYIILDHDEVRQWEPEGRDPATLKDRTN